MTDTIRALRKRAASLEARFHAKKPKIERDCSSLTLEELEELEAWMMRHGGEYGPPEELRQSTFEKYAAIEADYVGRGGR